MASLDTQALARDGTGFRLRGHAVTRTKTFLDAAFAFSLTLLVIPAVAAVAAGANRARGGAVGRRAHPDGDNARYGQSGSCIRLGMSRSA